MPDHPEMALVMRLEKAMWVFARNIPLSGNMNAKALGQKWKVDLGFYISLKFYFFSLKAQTKKSKKNLWPKQVVGCKVWKYLLSVPL